MSDATEGGSPEADAASRRMSPASSSSGHRPAEQPAQQHTYRCSCSGGGWPCEDDPPPYASLVEPEQQQQQRLSWSYVFQRYDVGPNRLPDNRAIARPLVSIPLTSYRIFKIEPPSYTVAMGQAPSQQPRIVAELGSTAKSPSRSTRKYSAILIAATVIIFLMALSLMVRLVTEKSFWRG